MSTKPDERFFKLIESLEASLDFIPNISQNEMKEHILERLKELQEKMNSLIKNNNNLFEICSNDDSKSKKLNSSHVEAQVMSFKENYLNKHKMLYVAYEKDVAFCTLCNVEFFNIDSSLSDHLSGKNHQKQWKKKLFEKIAYKEEQYFSVKNFTLSCLMCNIEITNPYNLDEHPIHMDYCNSHKSRDQKSNSIPNPIDANNDVYSNDYFCEICIVTIPNNDFNIREHIQGINHCRKKTKIVNKTLSVRLNLSPSEEPNDMQILENKQDNFINEGQLNSFNNRAKCTICIRFISNHQINIKEHIKGKNHLKILKMKNLSLESFTQKNESKSQKIDIYKDYYLNHFLCHLCHKLFQCDDDENLNEHYCNRF